MSISITYRLPPNIERVENPHYDPYGTEQYAPYKLIDRGNYPMGVYTVSGVGLYNGSFRAVRTTNESVTLLYRTIPNAPFPVRSLDLPAPVMDVNQYSFADRPYSKGNDEWRGISNEQLYDPAVFDYDAYEGQDTAVYSTIETVVDIAYTIEHSGRVYGFATMRLDQLPGFKGIPIGDAWYAGADPHAITVPPGSVNDTILGRYLIVISSSMSDQSLDHEPSYSIYPPLPERYDLSMTWTHLPAENPPGLPTVVHGQPKIAGKRLIIRYDSLYTAQTGPGFGKIFPYHTRVQSKYTPAVLTLPRNHSCNLPYRFYQGNYTKPFDLHRDLAIPPLGDTILPANHIPGSLVSIDGVRI
jgi:hypothetical protein